tara:strand:+ start:200 stop:436 length:237 start_codon:yes stop_codon:yes gene_type:complete
MKYVINPKLFQILGFVYLGIGFGLLSLIILWKIVKRNMIEMKSEYPMLLFHLTLIGVVGLITSLIALSKTDWIYENEN